MTPAHDIPPSFLGMDWLLAVNLWVFSTGVLIAGLICADEIAVIVRNRRSEPWKSPASIWRFIIALASAGFALRLGTDAMTLWAYQSPAEPVAASTVQIVQRFLDPIGAALALAGLGLAKLARPALIEQLRKEPLPIERWAPRVTQQQYAWIAALCLAASISGSFFR